MRYRIEVSLWFHPANNNPHAPCSSPRTPHPFRRAHPQPTLLQELSPIILRATYLDEAELFAFPVACLSFLPLSPSSSCWQKPCALVQASRRTCHPGCGPRDARLLGPQLGRLAWLRSERQPQRMVPKAPRWLSLGSRLEVAVSVPLPRLAVPPVLCRSPGSLCQPQVHPAQERCKPVCRFVGRD